MAWHYGRGREYGPVSYRKSSRVASEIDVLFTLKEEEKKHRFNQVQSYVRLQPKMKWCINAGSKADKGTKRKKTGTNPSSVKKWATGAGSLNRSSGFSVSHPMEKIGIKGKER